MSGSDQKIQVYIPVYNDISFLPDAVDSALVTVVDIGELHFQDIPDNWFQRDYLPHLKLD